MQNIDLLFLLLGAVLVLAMHAGFAFLELGTVRHKNQVNALSKILTDFRLGSGLFGVRQSDVKTRHPLQSHTF